MHNVLHVWALLAWHSSESVYSQNLLIVVFFGSVFIVIYKKNRLRRLTVYKRPYFPKCFQNNRGLSDFSLFSHNTGRSDNVKLSVKITVWDPLFFRVLTKGVFESLLRVSHITQQNIEIKTFKKSIAVYLDADTWIHVSLARISVYD